MCWSGVHDDTFVSQALWESAEGYAQGYVPVANAAPELLRVIVLWCRGAEPVTPSFLTVVATAFCFPCSPKPEAKPSDCNHPR